MHKTVFKKSAFSLSIIAANVMLLSGQQVAHAQGLEEVVVTAERRSESLQDTPMSVTAFSGDMVSQGGISNITDVAVQTPNFKLTTFNISEPQLFMRGVGSTNDSAGADPAVAVFVDDVYLGRPSGVSTELYDLERIEVLRGPQGTLYGRNAAGGALNIYTKKPLQEFEAKAGVTAGSESLVNVRGYVNGPISDTLAGKVTFSVRQRDGYAKNVTTGQELEDDDTKSVRGQLLMTPSDNVELLLGVDYTDIDTSGSNRFITNLDVNPGPPFFIDPQLAEIATFGNDERKSNHPITQVSEKTLKGLLFRADIDFNWATLTSITAYRESESTWLQALVPILSSQDGGQGLFEVNDGADQQADQTSQEFRLTSETDTLQWVVGLYYFDESVDKTERFQTYWDPVTGIIAGGALLASSPGDVTFTQSAQTTSYAAFGQATWNMTEALALTFGARYTQDEKSIDNDARDDSTSPGPAGVPLGLGGTDYSVSASETWDDTTIRATLDWAVTDSAMLYATYSEGFKSGAFNGQVSSPIIAATPLKPELATNYEIGARTQWFEDRLRLNLTYFQLDYEDMQTFSLTPELQLVAANASAESSGFEADFALAVTDNFRIDGNFATLDSEFTEGPNNGNDTPRSPEKSGSLSANYSVPMDNGAALDFRVLAAFTDEFQFEISNDPRGFEEDVTLWDASAKYVNSDANWDLTLWGKNLSDELYSVHHINGSLGGGTRIYAAPRTYGLSFNYYWN
jgi:iron complex outermembrane receptor protein